jgi:hypothetical protein
MKNSSIVPLGGQKPEKHLSSKRSFKWVHLTCMVQFHRLRVKRCWPAEQRTERESKRNREREDRKSKRAK